MIEEIYTEWKEIKKGGMRRKQKKGENSKAATACLGILAVGFIPYHSFRDVQYTGSTVGAVTQHT